MRSDCLQPEDSCIQEVNKNISFVLMEKEFDRMQQQLNNFFQDLKPNRPLTSYSLIEFDGTKKILSFIKYS